MQKKIKKNWHFDNAIYLLVKKFKIAIWHIFLSLDIFSELIWPLQETLSKTITVDDFTGKLFEIHQKIIDEGGSAQVSTIKVQL